MYPQHGAPMAPPPQKPETFMLSTEAQQSLPHDAQVALQQVDNRTLLVPGIRKTHGLSCSPVTSKILSPLGTSRLAARPADSPLPSADRRLCILRSLVSA
jgi:hypothetical protein